MNLALALQIIEYVVEHREDIKKMVLALQDLAENLTGAERGAVIKQSITTALNIEGQVEQAWPLFQPFFDAFVTSVKKKASTPAS